MKFLRLAEWEITRSTSGILGFITNHAWLDNPTFKGMRKHLLESFEQRTVLDLHGNANKKETALDGSPDENVFEIKQGVAISVLARRPSPAFDEQWVIQRSDLLGVDSFKFDTLLANTASSLASESFGALPPEYIFDRLDEDKKAEYEQFSSLPLIFSQNGDPAPGIVTTHDEFAISFTREEQIEKVEALLATPNEAGGSKAVSSVLAEPVELRPSEEGGCAGGSGGRRSCPSSTDPSTCVLRCMTGTLRCIGASVSPATFLLAGTSGCRSLVPVKSSGDGNTHSVVTC